MELSVFKISGTGNSFLCLKERQGKTVELLDRPGVVRQLCQNSETEVDGMIWLNYGSEPEVLSWDFYNKDGSKPEFCGNAARAICVWNFHHGSRTNNLTIETPVGPISTEIVNEYRASVDMPVVEQKQDLLWVCGVPHYIVNEEFDILNLESIYEKAFKLRQSVEYGSNGANITFCYEHENVIHTVSYERGVENWTLSCGTGAVCAAAFIKNKNEDEPSIFELLTPGGSLQVRLDEGQPKLIGDIKIHGEWTCPVQIKK